MSIRLDKSKLPVLLMAEESTPPIVVAPFSSEVISKQRIMGRRKMVGFEYRTLPRFECWSLKPVLSCQVQQSLPWWGFEDYVNV